MIFLGLGSNIGDRAENLITALRLLKQQRVRVVKKSSLYETAPVGHVEQPPFLNAVIGVDTSLSPQELLAVCLDVERKMGRKRVIRWGPRNIDIDILSFHGIFLRQDNLILPHPRLGERRFVLIPLAEIAGNEIIADGKTAGVLLAASADRNDVQIYTPGWPEDHE